MARTPIDDGGAPSTSAGIGRIRDKEIRNPWGRRGKPKPPVDFLDLPITIRVDGKPQTMPRREAIDFFLFGKAVQGDVKAIRLLEERWRRRQANAAVDNDVELSAEEKAAFDRLVRRAAARLDPEEPQ